MRTERLQILLTWPVPDDAVRLIAQADHRVRVAKAT